MDIHILNRFDMRVRKGKNISGGHRQRTAMARMFLSHRPIYLIGEGTVNIDEETENIVTESIKKDEGGKVLSLSDESFCLSSIKSRFVIGTPSGSQGEEYKRVYP